MTDETVKPLFVGIDVAKDSLEVALAADAATVRFANDAQGIDELLALLAGKSVALVVLEATGGLERRCAQALYLAGLDVIVANPRQAHDFARAMGHLAKTDAIDAKALSHFAQTLHLSAQRERMLLKLASPEQQQLDALVSRRSQLVKMRVWPRAIASIRRTRWRPRASATCSRRWTSRLAPWTRRLAVG